MTTNKRLGRKLIIAGAISIVVSIFMAQPVIFSILWWGGILTLIAGLIKRYGF